MERPEGDLGLQQLTRTCSERFGLGPAQLILKLKQMILKLKQTTGKRKSQPACPVCPRKQLWRRVTWDGRFSQQLKSDLARSAMPDVPSPLLFEDYVPRSTSADLWNRHVRF